MRTMWIASVIYALVFAMLEAYRWHVWSFGSDTGTFTQAILDFGGGFRDGPEQGSHFFYHFSPIIATLYPLVAATHSSLALQVSQVVLVALAAPALYALFRPYCDHHVALRLGLIALAYPPLAAIAFGEFHELAFFPILAIGMMWSADRSRWGWFALFALGCLLTREDVDIELALIGLVVAAIALIRRNAGGAGLLAGAPAQPLRTATAFAGLAVVGATTAGVYYQQVFAAIGHWPHGHFYDYSFAIGPPTVLAALLLHPQVVLPAVTSFGRFTYLIEALIPLVLLPFRSWWSALAVPAFVVVLLASEQSVWRMGNHYAAMWVPWLLIGAGSALVRLERARGVATAVAWGNVALAVCALTLIAFDPLHPFHYLRPPYADLASARAALGCVPHDAAVSTHDEWFSEISAQYPNATIQKAIGVEYLVYADDFPNDRFRQVMVPQLTADVREGRYSVVCKFGSVKTYRRF